MPDPATISSASPSPASTATVLEPPDSVDDSISMSIHEGHAQFVDSSLEAHEAELMASRAATSEAESVAQGHQCQPHTPSRVR